VEADGALGVAGGVDDLGRILVKTDALAFGEAFIGRGGFRGGDTDPRSLILHHCQQGQVVLIEQDGCASEALEAKRSADMINVGVGDENLLEFEAQFSEAAMDAGDLVAGIDDDCLASGFVTQKSAVALQWADGKGLEDHKSIVERE